MKLLNLSKYKIIAILMAIILVFIMSFSLYRASFKSSYKVESRKDDIKNSKLDNTLGWIKVQGTNIDYPVIYNSNVNLSSISDNFAWINKKEKELSNNTVIFGHNIRNVSKYPLIVNKDHERFEQLLSFIYYDFAKKNQYIQYSYNGKDYLYKIFSVSLVEDKYIDYDGSKLSKKDINSAIYNAKKDSLFNYHEVLFKNDKILTLVTCTRFYGNTKKYDFRIVAKLVKGKTGVNGYVSENKSYTPIKKILNSNKQQL